MQITLNDQGYIESYALIGGLVDGVEIEAPDELLEDLTGSASVPTSIADLSV